MVQSMRANQLPEHPFHDSWTCQSFQAGDSIPGVEELPGLPTKKKKASFPIKKMHHILKTSSSPARKCAIMCHEFGYISIHIIHESQSSCFYGTYPSPKLSVRACELQAGSICWLGAWSIIPHFFLFTLW